MDPTFDNLPYQIPGPAGGPTYTTLSQSRHETPNKADAARRFRQPAWHALLHHVSAPPFGRAPLLSSVALLRAHALSDRFERVQRLPVLIDALSWVGRDASVTLRDPTGAIRATLHAAVFDRWRVGVEAGAALLLHGVAAVAYVERRPAGFRTDADEGLHVSIQPCHVAAVFPAGKPAPSAAASVFVGEPRDSYVRAALAPPVVRRPPSRRAPPPPVRAPLRPRPEPQNVPDGWRPGSAGARRPYRGGYKGRHQYQRQSPPGGVRQTPHVPHSGKRPYAAPATPLPAVRRHGMQPLPKRPAPNRAMQSIAGAVGVHSGNAASNDVVPGIATTIAAAPAAPATGLNSLTDDQLDSLLGDFDVDAVIAASGKTQPVPAAQESTLQNVQAVPTREQEDAPEVAEPTAKDLQTVPTSRSTDKPSSGEKGPTSGPGIEAIPTQTGGTGQRSLSVVDEAMIDSLFEGLDDSDFR